MPLAMRFVLVLVVVLVLEFGSRGAIGVMERWSIVLDRSAAPQPFGRRFQGADGGPANPGLKPWVVLFGHFMAGKSSL